MDTVGLFCFIFVGFVQFSKIMVQTQEVCLGSEEKPKQVLIESLRKSPEVNVIFLIDRSSSIKLSNFNRSRDLMKQILQKYYVVHPNFARVSVIMYSISVIVALNHIYTPVISCELFGRDEIERKVVFKKVVGDGSALPRALDKALEIFQTSSRKNASKVLWILADGGKDDSGKDDHLTKASEMKSNLGVEIFSVGVGRPPGGWMEPPQEAVMQELASDLDHYACLEQWKTIVDDVHLQSNIAGYGDKVWYDVNDEATTYCGSTCDKNAQCYCNASSVTSSCTCAPQFYLHRDSGVCSPCPSGFCKLLPGSANCTADQCPPQQPINRLDTHFFTVFGIKITFKWFIVIIAVLVALVIIIILICVICCYWCRRKKREREQAAREGEINMAFTPALPSANGTLQSGVSVTDLQTKAKRPPPPPPKIPPQPKDLPPDYDDVIYGTVDIDMATMSKQKLHEGMEGWPEYMTAGVEARQLSGMYISTLDDSRWARTPQFRIKHNEIIQIAAILDHVHQQQNSGYVNTEVTLQGKKYVVHENNGVVLQGRGPIGGRSENVICVASNGDYIIVGKAPAEYDKGDCKMEVLRVLGHFQQYDQSYSTLR